MKKLLASCAAIALMAGPAFAQGTYDPTNRDQVPTDPTMTDETDPTVGLEQDVPPPVTDELPPEPEVTAETETETEEADPVLQADTYEENQTFADAEPAPFDAAAGLDVLEASINVDELPEEYSTDDLNAIMLAEVNEVANEISDMNIDAGDDGFAPEGQGDIDMWEDDEGVTAPEDDAFTTPQEDTFMTPPEEETFTDPDTNVGTDDYVLPDDEDDWTEPEPF